LLAGCKVDTAVTVDVHDDGSGTVRVRVVLDKDAVDQAQAGGGRLEDRIRLGDLKAGGWRVGAWNRAPDGSARITVSKSFASASELGGLFAELDGRDGPVHGIHLKRTRKLGLFTEYELRGTADLSQLRTGVTSDAQLVARLTAQKVDLGRIDQQLTQELRDAFHLRITVNLPGGTTRTFRPQPGKKLSLVASSRPLDTSRAVLFLVAIVLVLVALVLLVRRGGRGGANR
jgi:hypothetical protein